MDILSVLWTTVLPFLVILTIVVFVHEFGHFIIARINGVKVDVFSIGFGKELFGWYDRHGTRWRVSLLPLGGYVKFFGDANEASGGADKSRELSEEERRVSFQHKRVGQRFSIVLAGPAFNFIFAILVFAGVFMSVGQPTTPPVLGGVQEGSPAAEAGLMPGDRVIAINGSAVDRFEDIQRMVPLNPEGRGMDVTVLRDGEQRTYEITPRMTEMTDGFGNTQRTPVLGVSVSREAMELVRMGPVEAVGQAVVHTGTVVTSSLTAIGQMISGDRGTEDLGGPVRIAQFSGQAAQSGLVNAIMFVALLSVALGLFNLFPVPMLDGGHLLFYGIEALRGQPLSEQVQEYGFRVGLVLVLTLMVFVTWNDIVRLIEG
ncbi:RIP metalloprotease RseP [Caenispirillum salinarum]|uniref:RIP metalloprotease RseP n=1 Tax=Caenispirillum salinarum TaxID=859058 RepID=UPI00384E1E63